MLERMLRTMLVHRVVKATLLAGVWTSSAWSQTDSAPDRTVIDGITTKRVMPGSPYNLAGKRIVFTNWHYIQPGDLDWRDSQGKSVYVNGDEGPLSARHIAINAPHGIHIMAEKPRRSWRHFIDRIA